MSINNDRHCFFYLFACSYDYDVRTFFLLESALPGWLNSLKFRQKQSAFQFSVLRIVMVMNNDKDDHELVSDTYSFQGSHGVLFSNLIWIIYVIEI